MAALAAREAGLEPIVLEKEPLFGGSTAMSGGVMWLPDNPLQAKAGVKDGAEEALRYLEALVTHRGPGTVPARREAYVQTAPQVYELLRRYGVRPERCEGWADYHDELPGGCTRGRSMVADVFDARALGEREPKLRRGPRDIPIKGADMRNLPLVKITSGGRVAAVRFVLRMLRKRLTGAKLVGMGAALQGRIMQAVRNAGNRVELEAPVTGLLVENGTVVGVEATIGGKPARVLARKGVLVAAGGFARNAALRDKYLRQPSSADWSNANPGDQGDLLEKIVALGAATDTLEAQVFVAGSLPPGAKSPALHPATELGKPHIILVSDAGERFCDEAGSYVATGEAMYGAGAVPCWAIIESRARPRYFWAGMLGGDPPAAWLDSGYMKQADTLAGLAALCGIDAAGLEATVARFNAHARAPAAIRLPPRCTRLRPPVRRSDSSAQPQPRPARTGAVLRGADLPR